MTKIQQDALIYKEKAFTSAQRQFEKDLKKRQQEGWRLVSVTPTKKVGFGRIVQLTAIYERDITDYNGTSINDQPLVKTKKQAQPISVGENNTKEKAGMWEKIRESNRRAIEKELSYQRTLNPEQLRKRKRRNFIISSLTLLAGVALCIGVMQTPDVQTSMNAVLTPLPTDTPIPTPTPINLTTHQGVEMYARQVLDAMSPEKISYIENTKELQVSFYISSSGVWDNNQLKDIIKTNCFDAQKALWTSRLKGTVGSITIHIQTDLVDKYGNKSKGDVGIATMTSATNQLIQWDNVSSDSTWNNQVYDSQWMLPSVKNS